MIDLRQAVLAAGKDLDLGDLGVCLEHIGAKELGRWVAAGNVGYVLARVAAKIHPCDLMRRTFVHRRAACLSLALWGWPSRAERVWAGALEPETVLLEIEAEHRRCGPRNRFWIDRALRALYPRDRMEQLTYSNNSPFFERMRDHMADAAVYGSIGSRRAGKTLALHSALASPEATGLRAWLPGERPTGSILRDRLKRRVRP